MVNLSQMPMMKLQKLVIGQFPGGESNLVAVVLRKRMKKNNQMIKAIMQFVQTKKITRQIKRVVPESKTQKHPMARHTN